MLPPVRGGPGGMPGTRGSGRLGGQIGTPPGGAPPSWQQSPNPFGGVGELPGSVAVFVPTPVRLVAIVEVNSSIEKNVQYTVDGKKKTLTYTYVTHEVAKGEPGATHLYKGDFADWLPFDDQ